MRPVVGLIVLCVALLGAATAFAQDDEDVYADDEAPIEEPPPPPPAPRMIDVLTEEDLEEDEAPPTSRKLGSRDVGRMPGAFGDAFRAIEAMPGVAPMATGLPHLFVRGAQPSASGYYVDGIRVPFLFHLGVGPSVINPALVEDVTFYPGAFPARHGRHIGGIVAATTRPSATRIRAEGSIRLFDAGAFADVPIDAIDTSVFGGFRYSYLAPLLSLFAPDTRLEYWDYTGGFWHRLSKRDRVGVLAFGSSDFLGQTEEVDGEEQETELFGAEFHRVSVRYEMAPRARDADPSEPLGAATSIAFTFGYDRSGLSNEATSDTYMYQLSNDAEVPVTSWLRLRGGLDLLAQQLDFRAKVDDDDEEGDGRTDFDIREAFASRESGALAAWTDAVFVPVKVLEIVPGIRVDAYSEGGDQAVGVDPRATVRTHPTRWLTTITGFGRMHQKPALLVTIPGLDPVGLDRGLQAATQLSQAVELSLPEAVTAGVGGFYNIYDNLTDLAATCTAEESKCRINNRADGRAFGLELILQRPFSERIGGLVSYTLSRSEREVRGESFVADFDRSHVFNAALGVDLGAGWHAGARFTVLSGRPHSLVRFDEPDEPTEGTVIGKRNALRREAYHRLDLRIEKRWVIADVAWISLILEGFNVTLQREVIDFDCRVAEVLGSSAGLDCGGQEIGPISIPSLGVMGGI